MTMENWVKTLSFAAVVGSVCASLLASVYYVTAPLVERNQQADETRAILAVLGLDAEQNMTADEALLAFERDVRRATLNGLQIFEYWPQGQTQPETVAIPFSGPGVWGEIDGVLALAADMTTICAIRFVSQTETPGLGGEISRASFYQRFTGKRIVSDNGTVGFYVRKHGTAVGANEVDGLTGATMTSQAVGTMLNALAQRIKE